MAVDVVGLGREALLEFGLGFSVSLALERLDAFLVGCGRGGQDEGEREHHEDLSGQTCG